MEIPTGYSTQKNMSLRCTIILRNVLHRMPQAPNDWGLYQEFQPADDQKPQSPVLPSGHCIPACRWQNGLLCGGSLRCPCISGSRPSSHTGLGIACFPIVQTTELGNLSQVQSNDIQTWGSCPGFLLVNPPHHFQVASVELVLITLSRSEIAFLTVVVSTCGFDKWLQHLPI